MASSTSSVASDLVSPVDMTMSIPKLLNLLFSADRINDEIDRIVINDTNKVSVPIFLHRMGVPESVINSLILDDQARLLAFLNKYPLPALKTSSLKDAPAYIKQHIANVTAKFVHSGPPPEGYKTWFDYNQSSGRINTLDGPRGLNSSRLMYPPESSRFNTLLSGLSRRTVSPPRAVPSTRPVSPPRVDTRASSPTRTMLLPKYSSKTIPDVIAELNMEIRDLDDVIVLLKQSGHTVNADAMKRLQTRLILQKSRLEVSMQ